MQMLYQWEICGYTPAQVQATFFANQRADAEVEGFARDLFEGAVVNIDQLDRLVREQVTFSGDHEELAVAVRIRRPDHAC